MYSELNVFAPCYLYGTGLDAAVVSIISYDNTYTEMAEQAIDYFPMAEAAF